MKCFITLIAVVFFLINTAVAKPKNVVLILADDLGWADTTLYGQTSLYETPNLERLAKRGMIFSRAYASPICSPTRASIMTGQNPARLGMTAPAGHLEVERFDPLPSENGPPHQKSTNVKTTTRLDPALPLLSEVLKDAGYSTAHFGKWHLGREPHSPLEEGFDVDLPHWWGPGPKTGYLAPWKYENSVFKEGNPGDHIEERMASEAIRWLKQRDRNKPFFMNYWQFSVHAPFGAKQELIAHYRKKLGTSVNQLTSKEERERRLATHPPQMDQKQQSPTYAAMVHSLDDAVGSLLDALDTEGITEETIIIFYSDNGGNIHCGIEETSLTGQKYITAITSNHPLRGGKGGIHEGGIRVPAVVVWPGATAPSSRSDLRIQSADLYPTILKMLNISLPEDHEVDGVDFTPALQGKPIERGPTFTLLPTHGNTPHWLPPSMAVHHGDWKLIRIFHYGENGSHAYQLYDLDNDPSENNNLATTHPNKVLELDELIEDYIAKAQVVVPKRNPSFDASGFEKEKIGVQLGGLKMPPGFKRGTSVPNQDDITKPGEQKSIQGWIAKNAKINVGANALQVQPVGRQPFITNASIQSELVSAIKLRVKTSSPGTAFLQWRVAEQKRFPETGQKQAFQLVAGDWQNVEIPLPRVKHLIHLRLYLTDSKNPTEIESIAIVADETDESSTKTWNFKSIK